MDALNEAYAYCLDTLKQLSRDHYIACLLTPESVRGHMAALYLFDVETARIRDMIHEPMPGEIRLQWWRDVLQGNSDGAESGPLAHALKNTLHSHSLPVKPFLDLLDARIFDLYDDPMGSMADFELYAGETASAIIQLGLLVCDASNAAQNAEAAGHAGVALTISKSIRGLATTQARGQVYIPKPVLQAAGLTAETLLSSKTDDKKVAAAIEMWVGIGREHLKKAKSNFVNTGESHWPFLLVSLVESIFSIAQRKGSAIVGGASAERGPFARQWRLWRAARSKSF